MNNYNHKKIETKWQKRWEKDGLYKTGEDENKEKFYILDMFPYPSGAGLHVGHPKGYIATDIFARMKMMQGYNVLHPMGWDAFGLPAENFAIKNKVHPKVATDENIATFKSQLGKLGFSYDWDREINTTDPKFYKWTQWIFLQLFKKGLAYESHEPINWCPSCKTGLANEDLEDGKCERCGSEIEQKPMRQWVLKITDYADRMLDDLEKLPDWDESIKEMQKNWIGRSEGASVKFQIPNSKLQINSKSKKTILILHGTGGDSEKNWYPWARKEMEKMGYEVIIPDMPESKKPDSKKWLGTLDKIKNKINEDTIIIGHSLGCPTAWQFLEKNNIKISSLILIAPTHPKMDWNLIEKTHNKNQSDKIKDFTKQSVNWKKIQSLTKEIKILLSEDDVYIPINTKELFKKDIDAEYKIFSDKGHFNVSTIGMTEFPELLNEVNKNATIPLEVFTTRPDTLFGATYMVLAPEHPLIKNNESRIKNYEEVKKYIKGAKKKTEMERTELAKEKTGVKIDGLVAINPVNKEEIPVFIADYVMMGYGTGAIMAVPAHDERDFEFAEKYNLPIKEVVFSESQKSTCLPAGRNDKLENEKDCECFTGEGVAVNSGFLDGLSTDEAKKKMIEWLEEKNLGKRAINYKLKDWVFSRQRYWGEPIPLIHCDNCGVVAVPEKDLPVELPEVEHYEPTGTGESPLAGIKDWVNTTCPNCGEPAKRETNTMPQWAGSSWYYLRFIDPDNDTALVDKERDKYWSPVDFYVGGAEHATRHLIYARFWHKFLFDIGAVNYEEPFKRLQHVGIILAEDGRKMSKRWGNVINPDEIVDKYGADSMRVYEMFMGPFSQSTVWSTNGLVGARKFLDKILNLSSNIKDGEDDKEIVSLLHKTIKKVGEDIEDFKLNTAVSSMMILVNKLYEQKEKSINKDNFELFLKILSPFAPHLSEELWERLGNKESIFKTSWPKYNPDLAKDETVEFVVQINGKVRDRLILPVDISEEKAKEEVLKSEKIKTWLEGREMVKIIFVPGKLVNIVVR